MATEAAEKEKPEAPEGEGKPPVVDLAEKDGEEVEHERSAWREAKEQRFESWQKKKDRERREERDQLTSRLEQERQERERLAVELAEIRGRLAAQPSSAPAAAQGPDPDQARLEALEKRRIERYAANDWDSASEAEREIYRITARREWKEMQKSAPQQQAPDPTQWVLASEFPWLTSNNNARRAADGWINILTAKGEPDNIETYRKACRMAANDLNLTRGPLPPTTGAQRQLYGGTPPSRDVSGGDKTRIQPTEKEVEMARRAGIPLEALMKTRASNNPGRLE